MARPTPPLVKWIQGRFEQAKMNEEEIHRENSRLALDVAKNRICT